MDIPDPSAYAVPAESVHGLGVAGPAAEPPETTEEPPPPPPAENTNAVRREGGVYTEEGVGGNIDTEA